jgi:hypothetical protein
MNSVFFSEHYDTRTLLPCRQYGFSTVKYSASNLFDAKKRERVRLASPAVGRKQYRVK